MLPVISRVEIPSKAHLPIEVTEDGIDNFVKDLHPLNA